MLSLPFIHRRHLLRALAAAPLLALWPAAQAQSARQAEGILANIGKATFIAEGKGQRAIYIFFDPNCPFCHELYKKLRGFVGRDGVQLRWIALGMLTPSSLPKAAAILQSPDPLKAFYKNEDDYDFAANGQPGGGIEPAAAITPKVRAALAANLALYNSEKLFGVPVVVWRKADGRADMIIGVPSDAQIRIMLKEAK
ncbi:MAG: thioredoxin fold domain-containing protein [Thiomonas sp.]|uniref:thioredoxin fold domain-containing protein n=1 Tax=Thiomonas sp. TaxID=2047785 RepID=UPI002A36C791|nr:thioredoxin fold domain-containing protein [Thiomonas sp.]MDY0329580.1 thioredoxin fold domain-containing protein [Thiomonas sp.]